MPERAAGIGDYRLDDEVDIDTTDRRIDLEESMLVSAVRYALGRATYIVGWTVDEACRVWDDLHPGVRAVIRRDVARHLDEGGNGWPHDDGQWRRLLDLEVDRD